MAFFVLAIGLTGCNKEEPLPVSAAFTTSIQGNTLDVGQGFTVYTSDAEGEFLTYFRGDLESTTYGTGFGASLGIGSDSLVISGYAAAGNYTFTLVATSYGNWGETVAQDVQSIDITVTTP
ncbi:MAG: hypothetical protein EHM46_00985 [Bacteroidetes bacterium]|nr:MAG: hypothetical protein EHM46_00985 [Bacteroidota bacterium]